MTEPLVVRPIREEEYPTWNSLVETSPYGTVYHDTRWLKAACRTVGDSFTVYGFFQDDRLVAGLPLQIRKKGPFTLARRAFATPYANLVYDSGQDEHMVPALDTAIQEVAGKHSQTTVTGSPFAPPWELGQRWQASQRATYVLDISDPDHVWRGFVYQLRKKIRKAARLGITAELGCDPDVFFEIYKKTFDRRGIAIAFSRSDFGEFMDNVTQAGIGKTYVTKTGDGVPCAAGLALVDNKRAYYAIAGTDVEASKAPASAVLLWEIIRDLSKTHHELDLVGANIPSINRFKKQFRGKLVSYPEEICYRSCIEKYMIRLYQCLRRRQGGRTE